MTTKPWCSIYRNQPDWRHETGSIWREVRVGVGSWQVGVLLPQFGFAIWRDLRRVMSIRWA
jgi:hypothetical protein